MGLYPDGNEESVPFGIGVILPSFHSVGKVPEEIERLNNLHSIGAIQDAVHLSILGETPSLPVDLEVSSLVSSSKTQSSVHKKTSGQLLGQRYSWLVSCSGN